MAKIDYTKIILLFKSVWSGALGIAAEIILTVFFILTGFLVCLFWWSFR